jgi:hypothetical protein
MVMYSTSAREICCFGERDPTILEGRGSLPSRALPTPRGDAYRIQSGVDSEVAFRFSVSEQQGPPSTCSSSSAARIFLSTLQLPLNASKASTPVELFSHVGDRPISAYFFITLFQLYHLWTAVQSYENEALTSRLRDETRSSNDLVTGPVSLPRYRLT